MQCLFLHWLQSGKQHKAALLHRLCLKSVETHSRFVTSSSLPGQEQALVPEYKEVNVNTNIHPSVPNFGGMLIQEHINFQFHFLKQHFKVLSSILYNMIELHN